jgi:hypothetical protein
LLIIIICCTIDPTAIQLKGLHPLLARRVNIQRFDIPRPSALPFHVLTWGQRFVMHHNCRLYKKNSTNAATGAGAPGASRSEKCDLYKHVPNMKNINAESQFARIKNENHSLHFPSSQQIKYIYYTESDQLVSFKDLDTLRVISKGSNSSTLFLGRRAERNFNSKQDPEEYGEYYNPGRWCGKTGFHLNYQDNVVYNVDSRR